MANYRSLFKALGIVGLALYALSAAVPASAYDLTNRLGLGYNKQLTAPFISENVELPEYYLGSDAISAKYWFNETYGLNVLAGFNAASYDEASGYNFSLGGKFLANLLQDDWSNFYVGGGTGISFIHGDDGEEDDSSTGFLLMGFGGVEFFFQELPNLGFDLELGLQYLDVDKFQSIGTYGGGFGLVGFHYYF